jgi:hypothetical protein
VRGVNVVVKYIYQPRLVGEIGVSDAFEGQVALVDENAHNRYVLCFDGKGNIFFCVSRKDLKKVCYICTHQTNENPFETYGAVAKNKNHP